MSRHNEAFEIVATALPDLTDKQSLVLRAVCLHETGYGKNWPKTNNTSIPGPPGAGSNNMGAVTIKPLTVVKNPGGTDDGSALTCPANGFPHKDSRRDLKTGAIIQYVTCFRISPTPADGFNVVARTLLKPNVLSAIEQNDLHGVADAMRENRYYLGTAPTREEQVNAYHSVLKKGIASIVADTHEINTFDPPVITPPDPIPDPVIPPIGPISKKSFTPVLIGAAVVFGLMVYVSNIKAWQVKPGGAH